MILKDHDKLFSFVEITLFGNHIAFSVLVCQNNRQHGKQSKHSRLRIKKKKLENGAQDMILTESKYGDSFVQLLSVAD